MRFLSNVEATCKESWERFCQLGLPTAKTDSYQYVPLRKLYEREFSSPKVSSPALKELVLPECTSCYVVLVNGYFCKELSVIPEPLVVMPTTEAKKTFGAFIKKQRHASLKGEKDPFAALNAALATDELFIYLPPKTALKKPLQVISFVDETSKVLVHPRVQFFVGARSEMHVVATPVIKGAGCCMNGVTSFTLDDEAKVKLIQHSQGFPSDLWFFEAVRATLKRQSTMEVVQLTDGTEGLRHDYHVALDGLHSEAFLYGLSRLQGRKEAHNSVLMEHRKPHCLSRQLFKGVLWDTSRSSFEGKIDVQSEADKTEAYQLNNHLMLHEGAQSYSKPNLEIFADDVKASHGSTVGQLDPEQMIYLRSRGLSLKTSRDILVKAFCQEVVDKVTFGGSHAGA